jgi:hypothetical protein
VKGLERALVELGRELDVPDGPDLAPAVLARIEVRRERVTVRRLTLALALVVLATVAATLAIPEARSALFRVLDVGGARIELVDELPQVTTPPDLELTLGKAVSLDEARREAGFAIREPDEAPDSVYLGDRGTVWFVYGIPERVRLLVAQTPRHTIDQVLFAKKLAAAGTRVEPVAVGGSGGVYLSGEPHVLLLLDERGNPVEESARLARNVLLWEEGGIAFRLEGVFGLERGLELAASLR